MEEQLLENILKPLMEAQTMNNLMIKTGLLNFAPDDQYMIELYNVEDDIYWKMREIIALWPELDEFYLEIFDNLLFEHRLNILLVLKNIA